VYISVTNCLAKQSYIRIVFFSMLSNGYTGGNANSITIMLQSPGKADPCCNSTTCLLKSWATCKSGECCSNCLPKETKSLCRAAIDDCDAPEYCDGVHGEVKALLNVKLNFKFI